MSSLSFLLQNWFKNSFFQNQWWDGLFFGAKLFYSFQEIYTYRLYLCAEAKD
jgi:hypothetical protein